MKNCSKTANVDKSAFKKSRFPHVFWGTYQHNEQSFQHGPYFEQKLKIIRFVIFTCMCNHQNLNKIPQRILVKKAIFIFSGIKICKSVNDWN
jgi:hypothetical protein